MANVTVTPMMGFVEAVKTCFSKFATFSGRARRSEFWWFYLLNAILGGISSYMVTLKNAKVTEIQTRAIDAAFNGGDLSAIEAEAASFDTLFFTVMGIVSVLMLVLLIPTLAAWARRLHDTGKSGHLLWLILVCGVGGIVPLVMAIMDGQPGPNQYGESPKYKPVTPTVPTA